MIVDELPKMQVGSNGAGSLPNADSKHDPKEQGVSDDAICLELTSAQIENVIRATSETRGPSLSMLLSGLISERAISEGSLEDRYADELESGRLSHSLFRGLLILALFISGGEGRGVVEVARQLGLSPSTTHRYMTTLVAFGLLVQDPTTRKYRLPL